MRSGDVDADGLDIQSRKVACLLESLEDPFELFPLQSVARMLDQAIERNRDDFLPRQGDYGVARRYWDVESEHLHAEVGLLLGSTFVLGQTAVTQTTSLLSRLRNVEGLAVLVPASREEALQIGVPMSAKTGISELLVIDTAANYFKHHYEWPEQWMSASASELTKIQRRTISKCLEIGMSSSDVTDNLYCAFTQISGGGKCAGAACIPSILQDWREKLAGRLRSALGLTSD